MNVDEVMTLPGFATKPRKQVKQTGTPIMFDITEEELANIVKRASAAERRAVVEEADFDSPYMRKVRFITEIAAQLYKQPHGGDAYIAVSEAVLLLKYVHMVVQDGLLLEGRAG